jgi:hypothetical protein
MEFISSEYMLKSFRLGESMISFILKSIECIKFWNKVVEFNDEWAYLSSDKLLSKEELIYVYEKIGYVRTKYLIKRKLYPNSAGSIISEQKLLQIKPFGINLK